MTRRFAAAASLVTAALLLLLTAPGSAGAAAHHHAGAAFIRGAHFSPDTPGVDVYLTSFSGQNSTKLWLSNVGYGDIGPYKQVQAGLYAVSMRMHGAAPSSPPGLRWTFHVKAGGSYTVAAVGMNKHLRGIVLRDRYHAPAAHEGLVRVIQAASRAKHATVTAGSHTVASDAKFARTTGYVPVPAGRETIRVATDSTKAHRTVSIRPESVNSIVVLDSKHSGIQVRVIRDANGPAVMPIGPINAGGGGTAPRPGGGASSELAWVAVTALLAVALASLLSRRTWYQRGWTRRA